MAQLDSRSGLVHHRLCFKSKGCSMSFRMVNPTRRGTRIASGRPRVGWGRPPERLQAAFTVSGQSIRSTSGLRKRCT